MERTTPAIETVLARMEKYGVKPALFWKGRDYTYLEFGKLISSWEQRLQEDGIEPE
jgi:hypothetical protein